MTRLAARLLAPLALVAVAVVVYVVVIDNVGGGHHHVASAIPRARRSRSRVRSHRAARAPAYTVRAGDTLTAIADRTGVAISRLLALNPSLTPPYSLQTGERLRLRR